jgi:hypothetical protein
MLITRGLGGFRFRGVALPAARWLEAEAMSLSSPAQRSRPSISIRACTRVKNQWRRKKFLVQWRSDLGKMLAPYHVLGDAGVAKTLVVGLGAELPHRGGCFGGGGLALQRLAEMVG